MGFDKLSEILTHLSSRFPRLAKRVEEAQALSFWDEAVGAMIAKHARPTRVVNKTLWVEVDHPVWQTELHHRKNQILEILNKRATQENAPLKDILFLDLMPSNRSKFRTKASEKKSR